MTMGMLLISALLLLPLAFGTAAYVSGKKNFSLSQWIAIAGTAVSAGLSVAVFVLFRTGFFFSFGSFVGDGFSFAVDGFRALYGMMICFGWFFCALFGDQYFRHGEHMNRFWLFYMLTLSGTCGVFFAGDLVTLFVFFEVMSFSSFVWVAHEQNGKAFHAAKTYLTVTVISGMCLLMGLFLLYNALGTLSFAQLSAAVASCSQKGRLIASGICLLVGFGAKAGLFPIHIWLPKAHSASPAPASALLSGLLTKAGVFGMLAVTVHCFSGDRFWGLLVMILGYITMLLGGVRGIFSCELKETLAWSSVSQLGFISIGCALVGLMGEHGGIAAQGTLLYMLNHSTVKIVLFLCAGVVVANLHQLDLNKIKGFGRSHPGFMLLFLCGALSLCGLPPFVGYAGKTLLHEAILEYGTLASAQNLFFPTRVAEALFLLGGGCTIAYMAKLFYILFLAEPDGESVKKQVITPLSAGTVALPAAGLLLCGVFAGSFSSLVSSCLGFFGVRFAEPVNFFSLSNLSGALISLILGGLLFFVLIFSVVFRRNQSGLRAVNIWPEWLDLEVCFYRPVGCAVGFVLTAVCRLIYVLPDCFLFLLRKVFLAPSRPKRQPESGDSLAHLVASSVDGVLSFGDRHILHKEHDSGNLEIRLARLHTAFSRTTRKIILNFSFALLMACVGICLTLIYILFFSH